MTRRERLEAKAAAKVAIPRFATLTKVEREAVKKIVRRVRRLYAVAGVPFDSLSLRMDLSAVHAVTPLRLVELADASEFNLMHDVVGITRHLNRVTGTLKEYFVPRYAAPAPAEAAS